MRETVRQYYGEVLEQSSDLRTDACATIEAVSPKVAALMQQIHPEVAARYYGCGMVAPECLEDLTVLDLGCGAGRDCYLLSALVGENGTVIGIDMTPEQLAVARQHRDYHRRQFGFERGNVQFVEGYLESLHELDLPAAGFDLVVSNCVINLCTDKAAVLRAVHQLLKPGGELYFADVYADRRVPAVLRSDPLLYGECLSGALYWNDFLQLAAAAGFADPRLTQWRPIGVDDPGIREKVSPIQFYSATWRLFRIDELESDCEDYGHRATYLGTIDGCPDHFDLDLHHRFARGDAVAVCGNTWRMLAESRLSSHFELSGDFSQHRGLFDSCGRGSPFADLSSASAVSTGCC